MEERHQLRPFFKRAALWMAAVVLILASYMAGAPMVLGWLSYRFPAAVPIMRIIYAPLVSYAKGSWPGAESYRQYARWCHNKMDLTDTNSAPATTAP